MAVNAPEPGTITEFLAKEEDTVTVGQDLLKLELGGAPEGGKKQQAGSEAKAPAPEDQSTSSDPKSNTDGGQPKQKEAASPTPPPPKESGGPPKQENKPAPSVSSPKSLESNDSDSKPQASSPLKNREERRVSTACLRICRSADLDL